MQGIEFIWAILIGAVTAVILTGFLFSLTLLIRNKQKAFEREKIAMLQEYRHLVESMNDAVFVLNRDLEIILWNRQFIHSFGLNPSPKEEIELQTVFNGEIVNQLEKEVGEVFATQLSSDNEIQIEREKNRIWFELNYSPQLNTEGEVTGVQCIAHDITKRRKLELQKEALLKTLEDQKAMLADLSAEVIHAQEEERKNISRDLHDEIGQALTAVTIDLQIIREIPITEEYVFTERVKECQILVSSIIGYVREFSMKLRPALLDELSLEAAMKSYLRDYGTRTGMEVSMVGSFNEKLVDDQVSIVLYRIFQEGLNNIAKHAQAKNVEVELGERNDRLFMQVADDGNGFDIDNLKSMGSGKGGLGIKGMRERIGLVGGQLKLSSVPNKGTTIIIETPCKTVKQMEYNHG